LVVFFLVFRGLDGVEGGRRFAGAKRFALQGKKMRSLTANWTIDNCPLGRAAKGASPASSSKKTRLAFADLVFFIVIKNRLNLPIEKTGKTKGRQTPTY
jgi:hypothetical protein